ncbi:MAG TPA: cell division protein FtsA [Candidatus Saccharimonadia bacterium]|nr:cell division protein FtsA [Candidatus Saccharimonadia bacterium]
MRDKNQNFYIGLDVGSSYIRCIVGADNPDNPQYPTIIAHSIVPNDGIRKGVVVHIDDVAEAIIASINEVERISGFDISKVTTNINGSHVSGINSHGVIAISSINKEITPEDCLRVEEAATIMQLPPNKEIVQVFAKSYTLDGLHDIKDPIGMVGVRLEVDSHIVMASSPSLKNLYAVLQKADLDINHLTVSSLAAAEVVLTRQQKEAGTVLLDIGSTTTNIVVIEDGEIQHVAVLPMGGVNITNDLAIGLKTDIDVAEQVKIKHVDLRQSKSTSEWEVELKLNGEKYSFSIPDIKMIVEARLDELFEFVNKELQKINKVRKLPGGIVIVGGTANLPGIDEFARDKMQLPARIGKISKLYGAIDDIDNPSYSASIGLMVLDCLLGRDEMFDAGRTNSKTSITELKNKLMGHFKF